LQSSYVVYCSYIVGQTSESLFVCRHVEAIYGRGKYFDRTRLCKELFCTHEAVCLYALNDATFVMHDDGVTCNHATELVQRIVTVHAYGVSCLISTQLEQHCLAMLSLIPKVMYHRCPKYPAYIYPVASAIDTPLPVPAERNHIMLDSKEPWVIVPPDTAKHEHQFKQYPDEGIEEWHKKRKLEA